jgi:phosphatidylinositol alpha-1,6-mannosyltransferase
MKKVLFLNLMAFRYTGGLEKFNRSFLKALSDNETQLNFISHSYSLCDIDANEQYYPNVQYRGFGENKLKFTIASIIKAFQSDCIILGHINLAIIGFLVKLVAPSKKIVLICHGVEVWSPVSFIKMRILKSAKKILAVSSYTKAQIIKTHNIPAEKIDIFPNTIDAYFKLPQSFEKSNALLNKYGFEKSDFVLYTLCRVSSREQYKGYDYVIQALGQLQEKYQNIKYLVAGKYDEEELNRLKKLVADNKLEGKVQFAGYIDDKEIIDHYQLGDVYIMPSRGEGFGIVYIEALACGSKVIAGNADGSADAVANGALGKLVTPTSVEEIADAIEYYYNERANQTVNNKQALQQDVVARFGFEQYKTRLANIIPTII